MTTIRTRLAALLAALVVVTTIFGAWAPMDARAREGWTSTRSKSYLVGDVGPMRDMPGQALTFPTCTLGSLCFGDTVGDTFTVRIHDDSGRKVGGIVVIENRFGTVSHLVCGTSQPLRVVPGRLAVHLDAPGDVRGAHWFGGPGCTEIRPFGGTTGATTRGATTGRVDVTFTDHG